MLLTVADYWAGRDYKYKSDLTHEIIQNAQHWVACANLLLSYAAKDGVRPGIDQASGTPLASGWRPKGVNARTANSAQLSTHLDGRGGDLQDIWPLRPLAHWCLKHSLPGGLLEKCGIWMEHPNWTCTANLDPWCHWQTKPPGSGKRIYVPNSNPPTSPVLIDWPISTKEEMQ